MKMCLMIKNVIIKMFTKFYRLSFIGLADMSVSANSPKPFVRSLYRTYV